MFIHWLQVFAFWFRISNFATAKNESDNQNQQPGLLYDAYGKRVNNKTITYQ